MKTWSGSGCWSPREDAQTIRGAIIGTDRISFEVVKGGDPYTVELQVAPPGSATWSGTWRCGVDGSSGRVQARLYTAVDGGIVLAGHWVEDGDQFWVVELR